MLLDKNNKDQVRVWQEFLNTQGESLRADGTWGPLTDQATRRFQKMCVLREDGLVGDGTIAQAKARGFAGFPVSDAPKPITPTSFDPHGLLAKVHPKLAEAAQQIAHLASEQNFNIQVTQGLRTYAEQDALYNQGRTRKGPKVTNARGGESWHCFGLALDIAFITNGEIDWTDALYHHIGAWAATAGVHWAGLWIHPDLPHIQLPTAKSPNDQIRHEFTSGGLSAVWKDF